MPLVPDPITDLMLTLVNTPIAPGFAGTTTGLGVALAQLVVPAGAVSPTLAGLPLRFAGVGLDPLTGVLNRAQIVEQLNRFLHASERNRKSFAVLLVAVADWTRPGIA